MHPKARRSATMHGFTGSEWAEDAHKLFAKKGIELVAVDGNPIDADLGRTVPKASKAEAVPHDDKFMPVGRARTSAPKSPTG